MLFMFARELFEPEDVKMDRPTRETRTEWLGRREILGDEENRVKRQGIKRLQMNSVTDRWMMPLTRVAILMCVCLSVSMQPCQPVGQNKQFSQHPWAPVFWALLRGSVFHHRHRKCSFITADSEDKLLKCAMNREDNIVSAVDFGFSPAGHYLTHLTLKTLRTAQIKSIQVSTKWKRK